MHVFSAPWELVVLCCIPKKSNHFWNWPESALWLREHTNPNIQFPLLLSFEFFFSAEVTASHSTLVQILPPLPRTLSPLIVPPSSPFTYFSAPKATSFHIFSWLFTSCSWKNIEEPSSENRSWSCSLQSARVSMHSCLLGLMHQTWLIISHPKEVYSFFIRFVIRMKIFTKEGMISAPR